MIRPLGPDDLATYVALRRESLLAEPLVFASSPDDDLASNPETVREWLSRRGDVVILGAFGERLVGVVGLYRDRHDKASHKAHLWGMYVTAGHRRRGIARQLLEAALHRARALPGVEVVHLGVSSAAPAARRLYESAGFEPWGDEPDALRHDGRSVSELRMTLRL